VSGNASRIDLLLRVIIDDVINGLAMTSLLDDLGLETFNTP